MEEDELPREVNNMLTIFCIPRPWQNEFAVIQRNAIRGWLRIADEVLLLGDERGTAEAAAELHVKHIPEVERNAKGAPLVRSVFEQGEKHASYDLLAYANADIILFPCFRRAFLTVATHFCSRPFLMLGARWDVAVTRELDFADAQLPDRLHEMAQPYTPAGIDYFAFHRGLYDDIPAFALGRRAWDNWLALSAFARGAAVVDTSEAVLAFHQIHGNYPYIPREWTVSGRREKVGLEVEANRSLYRATFGKRRFWCNDAPYIMRDGRVVEREHYSE